NDSSQFGSHRDNSLRHFTHILEPLSSQRGIVHDHRGNSGTVHRWIRVEWADEDLELRHDFGGFFLRGAHRGKGSDTFAVKAHVLGKRLGQHQLVAFFNKQSHSGGIAVNVTGCEALIGHVEEWEEVALFDQVGQFFPLVQLEKRYKLEL